MSTSKALLTPRVSARLPAPGRTGRWCLAVGPRWGSSGLRLPTLQHRVSQDTAGEAKATSPLPEMPCCTAAPGTSEPSFLLFWRPRFGCCGTAGFPWVQSVLEDCRSEEPGYSAQEQTRPFTKGIIPGHLSLRSYLYSVLQRKPSTALCPRSNSPSIAGVGSPAAGLQPRSCSQQGECGKGLSSPGFPRPVTLSVPAALPGRRWSRRLLASFVTLFPGPLCVHPLPSAQPGRDS